MTSDVRHFEPRKSSNELMKVAEKHILYRNDLTGQIITILYDSDELLPIHEKRLSSEKDEDIYIRCV